MWMSATSAVPAEKLRRQPSALSATLPMPSAEHWMPSSPIRTSLSVQSHERYFLLFARKMSPKRNSLQLLKVFDGISRIRPPSRSACVSPKSAAHSALPHYLRCRKNGDAQVPLKAESSSELSGIDHCMNSTNVASRVGTNQVPTLDMMPYFSCELLVAERKGRIQSTRLLLRSATELYP